MRCAAEADEARDHPEGEDARSFDEEGAALGEELLERREVHERRVDIHLAEVRIDRAVEREVRGDPVLQVEPGPAEVVRPPVERIPPGARGRGGAAAHEVGEQLHPPRGGDVPEPEEVGEARY